MVFLKVVLQNQFHVAIKSYVKYHSLAMLFLKINAFQIIRVILFEICFFVKVKIIKNKSKTKVSTSTGNF